MLYTDFKKAAEQAAFFFYKRFKLKVEFEY